MLPSKAELEVFNSSPNLKLSLDKDASGFFDYTFKRGDEYSVTISANKDGVPLSCDSVTYKGVFGSKSLKLRIPCSPMGTGLPSSNGGADAEEVVEDVVEFVADPNSKSDLKLKVEFFMLPSEAKLEVFNASPNLKLSLDKDASGFFDYKFKRGDEYSVMVSANKDGVPLSCDSETHKGVFRSKSLKLRIPCGPMVSPVEPKEEETFIVSPVEPKEEETFIVSPVEPKGDQEDSKQPFIDFDIKDI